MAEALKAAGHGVIAIARTPEKAALLESRGYRARAGNIRDAAGVAAMAREVGAVIHAAAEWGSDIPSIDNTLVDALAVTGTRLIYTSGVWVHGDTKGRIAGEMSALDPVALVAWRPAVERKVMDAGGIVIRPAMVYGRGGGSIGDFAKHARETGVVRVIGTGENHWTFVHVEDLADLYIRALERAPAGEVYLGAAGVPMKARDVASALGKVEFWPVDEARHTLGPKADALAADIKVGSTKAGRQLGWFLALCQCWTRSHADLTRVRRRALLRFLRAGRQSGVES